MADYIDRELVFRNTQTLGDYVGTEIVLVKDIKDLPSADVVEQKHGHWIYRGNDFFECSCCKHYDKTRKVEGNNFCKWCGAKMNGVEE